MESGGIFGSKMSGKTTLAKSISVEYWKRHRIASLVLDPNNETWGSQAKVFTNENDFWQAVWGAKQPYLVVVDESTETIARNKELLPVFTRLRHLHHKLLVIGHHGTNLLPIMREQLDTLYLFKQSDDAAKIWANIYMQPEIRERATRLQQYEFLHTTLYGQPKVYRLKL